MQPKGTASDDVIFVYTKPGCTFRWECKNGYFHQHDGIVMYPTSIHQVLKPALIREHGYMYIASVEKHKQTWRCAVKDCPNMLVDEV